mgnify:CR=1 FL=1
MFEKLVGQKKAKRKLKFFIECQNKTLVSPNILIVAPKGCGKTLICKEYASNLIGQDGNKKKLIEINCSTLTSLSQFMDCVVIPYINTNVTVFFDEASEIPRDVSMALLTILNPNERNSNVFVYQDNSYEFDFKKMTFLFATTESHLMFHALVDRLERIDLEEYNLEELGYMIQKQAGGCIDPAVLIEVSRVLRGTARKAIQISSKIKHYLSKKGKDRFGQEDWEELKYILSIPPLGLTELEIKVLKILSQKPETTLTNLSAKTMMTRTSLQADIETYLQKMNLMEVAQKGRKLTLEGKKYLLELKE